MIIEVVTCPTLGSLVATNKGGAKQAENGDVKFRFQAVKNKQLKISTRFVSAYGLLNFFSRLIGIFNFTTE